jgi:spore germination protein GerM
MRLWAAAAAAALLCVSCSHRTPPPPTPQITVYFCRAGTDTLVPSPFSANPALQGEKLEAALVGQLIAGPADSQDSVVLFPAGTQATVSAAGDVVTVNFTGELAKKFHGGASDEVALFKSLTYTVTSVPGMTSVQILIDGRKRPTLPGGEFEIDEPLTRGTFSQ